MDSTTTSAVANLQAAADALPDLASNTWNDVVRGGTAAFEMLRDDPVRFMQTVAEVNINASTVVANQFTFGLIPSLQAKSDSLVASNGYYRVLQVGAIVAREASIAVLTGGTGTALGAGIRGVGLVGRYVGPVAGRAVTRFVASRINPTLVRETVQIAETIGCWATTAQRSAQPLMFGLQANSMYQNAGQARAMIAAGDYEGAAAVFGRSLYTVPSMAANARASARMINAYRQGGWQQMRDYLAACFTADTAVATRRGQIPFDQLREGDEVLARSESDPQGALEYKRVEEIFRTVAAIWHLHVAGQVVRTTSEHPFWVVGKGWTPAHELAPGDLLLSRENRRMVVEECMDAGYDETVYNCRVADFATYFVGDRESWGFDVWAHNTCAATLIGQFGEGQARALLRDAPNKYKILGGIRNASNQGIDIVARDGTGRLVFIEVKASASATSPALTYQQNDVATFVRNRLQRAAGIPTGNARADAQWAGSNTDDATRRLARRLLKEIQDLEDQGLPAIRGQIIRVTNLFGGNSKVISVANWGE